MDVSLMHPFSMLVFVGSGVGKTEFTKKLLKGKLIAPPLECIVWCYAKHQQDLFEELMKMNEEYVEGIPGELDNYFKKNKRNLIILDGLMDEASKSLKIAQIFTRGCHDNFSVIYLTQNLFHEDQRALSMNSDYMVIFKNPRDNLQFATIARQIRLDKVNFLMWAYKDAISSSHTNLMLDLKPDTEEMFQVRSNIFEDPQHVYIAH